MALSKEIPVGTTGVSASYWRLIGVNLDFVSGEARVTVAGYLNQANAGPGATPLVKKTVVWTGPSNPITIPAIVAGTAFAAAYQKLTAPETRPMMPPNPLEGASFI